MSIATRVSTFNRTRKWELFLSQVRPTPDTTILDVGYNEKEFSPVDNFIEKHYPYPERLTALGITAGTRFSQRYPAVKVVTYDGRQFPFGDQEFDVCWSNAVLEHTGDAQRQLIFLKEIARVSKRAFVTTPNRMFPIEVHTRTPLLHYLPKSVFYAYLTFIGKQWATGNYMSLLSERDLRDLLDRARIERYRLFKNRLLGFTLDFALVIDPLFDKLERPRN